MILILPLPPRELQPNVRTHWAKKAKAVRYYREQAWAAALVSGDRGRMWERAEAWVTFFFPTNRRRDSHNFAAALKACWDGIEDAGVIANDSGLTVHPPVLALDRSAPRVVIDITET